jgi:hypothetical protein
MRTDLLKSGRLHPSGSFILNDMSRALLCIGRWDAINLHIGP